ncbi:EF-hand domain-containing protein [Kitasatospora sp. NPDC002040]|uniref:EF-hand domain-containing protein n=1 Tax=Kitasatospora sp. NPDC002040 TaxID=3154661 RepID=UPI00332BAA5A
MTSDVLRRKYDRAFDLFDADGNGVLEERDFVALAESIARATGLADGSAKEAALLREWRRSWTVLLEQADADQDGRISREEFQQALSGTYGDPAKLAHDLRSGFEAEFAAIDSDDDGVAPVEQMEAFLTAWGLEPAEAKAASRALDQDGDGHITLEEYLTGWTAYLLDEDGDAVGSTLLGPLA